MNYKKYFALIALVQDALLTLGIGTLLAGPLLIAYGSPSAALTSYLFDLSLWAVFFVMVIRPLADLMPGMGGIRPLVILRKGFGVASAAIVVAFLLAHILTKGAPAIAALFSASSWSLAHGAFLSPLGDLAAIPLLVTSNSFSKRILGRWWKRIQRLSYVYFYAGALYEYTALDKQYALILALIVTALTVGAFIKKRILRP